MTFPRLMIERGLGADAVTKVMGSDADDALSVDQIREIARQSRRRFWLCGDWIRAQPLSISDVTARRVTAAVSLAVIDPGVLYEVKARSSLSLMWCARGWGR